MKPHHRPQAGERDAPIGILGAIIISIIVLGIVYLLVVEPYRAYHSMENKFCSDKMDGSYIWGPCDVDYKPWFVSTCAGNGTITTVCADHKAEPNLR